jgi:hypothetical protein
MQIQGKRLIIASPCHTDEGSIFLYPLKSRRGKPQMTRIYTDKASLWRGMSRDLSSYNGGQFLPRRHGEARKGFDVLARLLPHHLSMLENWLICAVQS